MKLNPTNHEVVDFDLFDLDEPFHNNTQTALQLSNLLSAYSSVDDIICLDPDSSTWQHRSIVGTGGGSMAWHLPNRGLQRMVLATHFASYGLHHYQSCYLSIYEYQCLKQLLTYIQDESSPGSDWNQQQIYNRSCAVLQQVCWQFEKAYSQAAPEFLFELLKTAD